MSNGVASDPSSSTQPDPADGLILRSDALAGHSILVTGGGSGLGLVMAEAFARLGARVHICGRRSDALNAAAASIREQGGVVRTHVCDIRNDSAVDRMIDAIWAEEPLTGLVNNAAGNFISRTEDLSMKGFDAIANIVFRGTFSVTHACGRRWLDEGRRASVLSILATWVWNGSAYTVPSAMSKAGLRAMTQSLAVEWGGRGVRFNAIAPGPFPTAGVSARLWPTMDREDAETAAGRSNPMRRVGRPSELANLAAFLMSPAAEFINGETIAIDGGRWLASGGNFSHLQDWSDADWQAAGERIRASDRAERAQRG